MCPNRQRERQRDTGSSGREIEILRYRERKKQRYSELEGEQYERCYKDTVKEKRSSGRDKNRERERK